MFFLYTIHNNPDPLIMVHPTTPGRYRLSVRLKGHKDAVMSLGISTDAKFLGSGGYVPNLRIVLILMACPNETQVLT
jgi:hypothetical protein